MDQSKESNGHIFNGKRLSLTPTKPVIVPAIVENVKFENILRQIGDEGRFQMLLMCLLLVPACFLNTFYESMLVLTTPDHWCTVPQLQHLPIEVQHKMIRPVGEDNKMSTCTRYDLNYTEVNTLEKFLNITQGNPKLNVVSCSTGIDGTEDVWTYDQSLYMETGTTWFNFVCDRDHYVNHLISVSAIGLTVVTPILSHLSDKIGRRRTLLIAFIMTAVSCFSPMLVKTLPLFAITRFIAGGVLNVNFQLPFIITQELVSEKYRARAACLSALAYSIGNCCLPIIIKWSRSWVNFSYVQFVMIFPFLIFYKFIPESPSWLISMKNYDQAYRELERVARVNKKPVPSDLKDNILLLGTQNESEHVEKDSFKNLLTMPGLRSKTLAITFTFSACLVAYSGIYVNTINYEAQNQLNDYLLLSVSEIPALLIGWYLVNTRLGRRWTNVGGLVMCTLATLVPTLLQDHQSRAMISACTLLGKFGVSITFMVIYQHAGELYPTTLRSQGIGLSAAISSVVAIFVPQVVYLAKFGQWIPLLIISIVCLLGSFVSSTLPETLNKYLPQTSEEAAKFTFENGFFSLAPPKRDDQSSNGTSKQQDDDGKAKSNQADQETVIN